jgi:hypothetical protein
VYDWIPHPSRPLSLGIFFAWCPEYPLSPRLKSNCCALEIPLMSMSRSYLSVFLASRLPPSHRPTKHGPLLDFGVTLKITSQPVIEMLATGCCERSYSGFRNVCSISTLLISNTLPSSFRTCLGLVKPHDSPDLLTGAWVLPGSATSWLKIEGPEAPSFIRPASLVQTCNGSYSQ